MPFRRFVPIVVIVAALGAGALFLFRPATSPSWVSSAKGAEFRYIATSAYEDMRRESCPPVTRYPRSKILADQIRAVRDFETKLAGTNAEQQLEIVRADIDHRMAIDEIGCWSADDDPDFAKMHIDMAKKTIEHGLGEMARRVPALGPQGEKLRLSAANGAAFRLAVRDLENGLNPLCAFSSLVDNDDGFAAARAQADAFRTSIAASPYADHYDIARADAHYKLSITMVECANPEPITHDALEGRTLKRTKDELDALRRLMDAAPA